MDEPDYDDGYEFRDEPEQEEVWESDCGMAVVMACTSRGKKTYSLLYRNVLVMDPVSSAETAIDYWVAEFQ